MPEAEQDTAADRLGWLRSDTSGRGRETRRRERGGDGERGEETAQDKWGGGGDCVIRGGGTDRGYDWTVSSADNSAGGGGRSYHCMVHNDNWLPAGLSSTVLSQYHRAARFYFIKVVCWMLKISPQMVM